MLMEYIYKDNTYKTELQEISVKEGIEFSESKKEGFYVFSYEAEGENLDSAKDLSEIHEQIIKKFSLKGLYVLTNGAGEYFNRTLYPIYNKFERLLRKVLYIIATKNQEKEAAELCNKIEELEFGKIYEILFTSENFIKEMKKIVNNNTLTKIEYIEMISDLEEECLWGKLFDNQYKYVKENFTKIRKERNHVMHAYNFSYDEYAKAKNLISKGNTELKNIIDALYGNKIAFEDDILTRFNERMLGLIKEIRENAIKIDWSSYMDPMWLQSSSNEELETEKNNNFEVSEKSTDEVKDND